MEPRTQSNDNHEFIPENNDDEQDDPEQQEQEQQEQPAQAPEPEELGPPPDGNLGVKIHYINKPDSLKYGKPVGFMINEIKNGGPAEKAGLDVGDIIVKVNQETVWWDSEKTIEGLDMLLEGDSIEISYWPNLSDFNHELALVLTADEINGFNIDRNMDLRNYEEFSMPVFSNPTDIIDIVESGKWILVGGAYNRNSLTNYPDASIPSNNQGYKVFSPALSKMWNQSFFDKYDNNGRQEQYDFFTPNDYSIRATHFTGVHYWDNNIYLGSDNRLYICNASRANGFADDSNYEVYESDGLIY